MLTILYPGLFFIFNKERLIDEIIMIFLYF